MTFWGWYIHACVPHVAAPSLWVAIACVCVVNGTFPGQTFTGSPTIPCPVDLRAVSPWRVLQPCFTS